MKKFTATFVLMAIMAIMLPLTATAQTRRSYSGNRTTTTRNYQTYPTRNYQDRSVYDKHRNLINIGIGTGAGTLLGALIGGRKGALIGAAAGAGGSALYTYKINPKDNRYYRRH